jgi:acetyl-CoA carboxylase carboxyl transferase subunit alpha
MTLPCPFLAAHATLPESPNFMEVLPLEKPLLELSNRIAELRVSARQASVSEGPKSHKGLARAGGVADAPKRASQGENDLADEIRLLEQQFETLALEIFSKLTPYEVTQLSRHPHRPYTLDIVEQLCTDFMELQGDRNFMNDNAIVGGLANFRGHRVVVVGHQKGRGTKENMKRNFGMPKPEGYRKALRLMSLAERFHLPILTFIDTPGAYPGIDAEERGQSEAIAKNIMVMFKLGVPIISLVVGEGGSGGALAIGVGNKVLMMQLSTYSVISPEGCASILWKDGSQAARAAEALGVTAQHALKLGVIDDIIPEPLGGAHWKPKEAIESIGDTLERHLVELKRLSPDQLRRQRAEKFERMGAVQTLVPVSPFRREEPPVSAWGKTWEDVAR